jgi:hypothetical protein
LTTETSSMSPRQSVGNDDDHFGKPPHSYATLIGMAISETAEKRARLSTIYSWITQRYPFYRLESGGWQVRIRMTGLFEHGHDHVLE